MDAYYLQTPIKERIKGYKKISQLLNELYSSNPGSVLYGFLHHTHDGKKILKDFFIPQDEKSLVIPQS